MNLYFVTFCGGCKDNVMHTTPADHGDLLLFEEIRFPKGIKHNKQKRNGTYEMLRIDVQLNLFLVIQNPSFLQIPSQSRFKGCLNQCFNKAVISTLQDLPLLHLFLRQDGSQLFYRYWGKHVLLEYQ